MRVIAGMARGRKLMTPKDGRIRPTLDRVREALFNILASKLAECRFLDLFAGTGANGVEALSRGAKEVLFVDNDRRSIDLSRQNVDHCGLNGANYRVLTLPEQLGRIQGPFDLIFADPPYDFEDYEALLNQICAHELLAPEGLLIVEHKHFSHLPESGGALQRSRQKRYGRSALSFYT
jgi:16S rRNA (guanine(966)-N(2))-methyltransferase RsmD